MISLLVLDVDGTLTAGGITINSDGSEGKTFNSHDGLILKVMAKLGVDVMFLTGRNSPLTALRASYLGVKHIAQDVQDKHKYLSDFIAQHDLSFNEVAYVGDDLNDYLAMQPCGFKACPADAATEIMAICDYVSTKNGGQGAVRDACEALLRREDKWQKFLEIWGA
jgi:3-deoxy-D-manno-octulosonate 8-phosphate phosphatase (KDO 8-P phosphatase)